MPEQPGDCPDRARLHDFHAGRLDGQEAERLATHAEACDACRAELGELEIDDHYALDLRAQLQSEAAGSTGGTWSGEQGEAGSEFEALSALLRESARGGRYEVMGELGRGGMGVVLEVRDHVLKRDLAMKVVRAGVDGDQESSPSSGRKLARFLEEARITGQLDHPSIVPVHELGIDDQGRAFFTMRKVRGKDLSQVIEAYERGEGGWTLQRLVASMLHACDALAYAHSKRVVHRDLKPANIMLGRFGAVYVVDWGVATLIGEARRSEVEREITQSQLWSLRAQLDEGQDTGTPEFTLAGEVIGTPAYMAPEQALGRGVEVDKRVDVYSMGAIFYRLLSGRRPYDDDRAPSTPIAAWKRLLDGPAEPLTELAPKAPPELVSICQRAMARQPEERYPDMAGLTADLRAWLEGRVVRTHSSGVLVELRKWTGRNRALAALTLLVLAIVSGLLIQQARGREAMARGASTIAARELLGVDPAQALRLGIDVAQADENHLTRTVLLAALVPLAQDAHLASASTVVSSRWSMGDLHLAWSRDGRYFAFGERQLDGQSVTIRVWDTRARRYTADSFDAPATELYAFHPDGLLIAAGGADGSITLHDRPSGASRPLVDRQGRAHADLVSRLAFDPRGELLASASWDGTVRLWKVATGALVRRFEGHTGIVTSLEFDAAGLRLLSASGPTPPARDLTSDHSARVWEVASGACLNIFEGHAKPITSARFHPGGELVLSTSYDHSAQLWSSSNGVVHAVMSFDGVAWDGAFSPDGARLAVGYDGGMLVREIESGLEHRLGPYQAHDGRAVSEVEFSPGSDRLLTVGYDGVGRVWNLDPDGLPQLALRLARATYFGSWSPDGSAIVTPDGRGVRFWFTEGNPTTDWVQPTGSPATRARFHPAGDRVLLTFEGSPAYEYAHAPGQGLLSAPRKLGEAARDVAISADGRWTLVAQKGGRLGLWRRDSSGESREAGFLELDASSLRPARRCNRIGVILEAGGAAVVDCSDRPTLIVRLLEQETVETIRFSDDGQRVALGTEGGRLQVLELGEETSVLLDAQLDPHSATQIAVFDLAFHDGGRRLISAGPQGGVLRWDLDSGGEIEPLGDGSGPTVGVLLALEDCQRLLALDRWGSNVAMSGLGGGSVSYLRRSPGAGSHRNRIRAAAVDDAQRRLLTASLDHAATVWDLERAEPWVSFVAHEAPILAADISRDGKWAVTADASGRVHVWPTDPLRWALAALPVEVGPEPR